MYRRVPLTVKLVVTLLVFACAAGSAAGWAEFRLRRAPVPVPELPPGSDGGSCVEPSLTRGYAPRPNVCGRDERAEYAWSFPGVDPERVLLLGDSVGVHRWVGATSRALAGSLAPRGLALRNTSVTGYDTCQEAATWEERWEDPDLLVLQTCPNDLRVTPALARLPGDRVRYFGTTATVTFPAPLLRSRLLTTVAIAAGERWWPDPGAALGVARARGPDGARGCLAAIQDSAARAGVPLVVLFFPGFDGGPRQGGELLQEGWFRELGLDVVDVRALLTARDPALLVSPDRVHPDSEAQTTALAELLAPELRARLDAGAAVSD